VTFLARENENEAKSKAAKYDEQCRRQSGLNAIFKFKRLEDKRKQDSHSNNKDPEHRRIRSGEKKPSRLLMSAGGTQMPDEKETEQA
jgi:hypothetical protein